MCSVNRNISEGIIIKIIVAVYGNWDYGTYKNTYTCVFIKYVCIIFVCIYVSVYVYMIFTFYNEKNGQGMFLSRKKTTNINLKERIPVASYLKKKNCEK